jgi:hypothetical protein
MSTRDTLSTQSRQLAAEVEIDDWLSGNVFIGRGLGYCYTQEFGLRAQRGEIAYGHVGYVTYLSQLGLLGFFVYGLWLPFATILPAQRFLRRSDSGPASRHLVSLAAAIYIYFIFLSALSGSLLQFEFMPGILAGVVAAFGSNPTSPKEPES